jgi:hypothetical protein
LQLAEGNENCSSKSCRATTAHEEVARSQRGVVDRIGVELVRARAAYIRAKATGTIGVDANSTLTMNAGICSRLA